MTIIDDDLTFVVIQWPDVQELLEEEGFCENTSLVNDEVLLEEFGFGSYFVRKSWLKPLINQ